MIPKISDLKKHPWGDTPYGSREHNIWLAKDIFNKNKRSIIAELKLSAKDKMVFVIKNNIWDNCEVQEEFARLVGPHYQLQFHSRLEMGGTLIVFKPT